MENSPKWWTLLILTSRIQRCYKTSKHTCVFLFSLTGADCCCVGALKNILILTSQMKGLCSFPIFNFEKKVEVWCRGNYILSASIPSE